MLEDSGLSKLEREMIATVVSSLNHCFYCLVVHGAAVRKRSGDPVLGELMLEDSGLSKLEREMIATVVSSLNHCYYCLVVHGAAVRKRSGDPVLGELMAMNYREAELDARQRAMLDFAAMITERSHEVGEAERQKLRDVGFSDPDIWDIVAVAAFFNMTNRMASASGQIPNLEYHALGR
jgi:uncharacterized peroxidase-related enzyme